MLSVQALRRPGLHPVDLTLLPGQCLGVSGPSGSGKTLLLRALADLDPNDGQVMLEGRLRSEFPAPEWRRRVAYLPAEPGWWALRVRDHFTNLSPDLLEALGLSPAIVERKILNLSTGERQRLALARLLLQEPSVLLLDEPTSGLDPDSTKRVEALLQAQLREGRSIVLVTHNAEQAGRLTDVRWRMDSGHLSEVGP
ncbi:ATP-binding cassette domain-containing protein [Magnetospira thiophila]